MDFTFVLIFSLVAIGCFTITSYLLTSYHRDKKNDPEAPWKIFAFTAIFLVFSLGVFFSWVAAKEFMLLMGWGS